MRFARSLCLAVFVLTAVHAGSSRGDEANDTVVTLHPMAAPDPMMKYRLWPGPHDRTELNPMHPINRALIMLYQQTPPDDEAWEKVESWADTSPDELPIEEVQKTLAYFGQSLDELASIENAMRIEYSLDTDNLTAAETASLVVPELQDMRLLARLIELRAKLEIGQSRYDDAIATLRLGFRLSDAAGNSTHFLVGKLIGVAIAQRMFAVIETAIIREDFPNLYWALAAMPSDRLFRMNESLEHESVLLNKLIQQTGEFTNEPIGRNAAIARLEPLAITIDDFIRANNGGESEPELARLMSGVYVAAMAEPSRELLAATAIGEKRASELSAAEAVLRSIRLRWERHRDRYLAWTMLPPELWTNYETERDAAFGNEPEILDPIDKVAWTVTARLSLPISASYRAELTRNRLMLLEAIRMHANDTGQLPETLSGLRPVPAWLNPLTALPFGYQLSHADHAVVSYDTGVPAEPKSTIHVALKVVK
ncbi:hypothetical protein [Rubripirellula reticaptiva]|uniref:Uncharacterized protein n=1 Tax=Rubripirellula reticaptiva TaxID=2528013 RepID=A0A5C6EDL2_9BACT|nr:hypothetical protein [Rubripirellula reticaptiva]TWU47122.1 hypothetical protein Poly59_60960 [Rubripirellula reticaptiva]